MKLKAAHHANRSSQITTALVAVATLLAALAFAKVVSFHVRDVAAHAHGAASPDANALEQHLQRAKEMAASLKKSNLFAQEPPRKHPVTQIDGILGDEVLIAGKWYKIGHTLADAKIVAIAPTEVKIEWEGREKAFSPMAAADAEAPPRGAEAPQPPRERPAEPAKEVARTAPVQVRASAPPPPQPQADGLAWMGVELPANVKGKLLEHWNTMSPGEQAEAREKWHSMPDDEKRRAIEAMERNL